MPRSAGVPGATSDREFQELADHAPVMIWRADPSKGCDWFNRPWLDFTGRPIEAELGFGWAEGVHLEDLERCIGIYHAAFDARRSFSMEYRLRRRDGAYRWLLDNGAPFYREGAFAGYFGSCVDVTEQKEREAAVARALAEKTLLEQELQHRVGNTMQLIVAMLALQQLQARDPAVKAMFESVSHRVRSLGLVHSALGDQGGSEEVELGGMLGSIARTLVETEAQGTMRLEVDTRPCSVPTNIVTPLGMLVHELVLNAVKHAGAGGVVRLTIKPDPAGRIRIEVADRGPGLPPGVAPGRGTLGMRILGALASQIRAVLSVGPGPGARLRLELGQNAAPQA